MGIILILGIVAIAIFSIDRENILKAYREVLSAQNKGLTAVQIEETAQRAANAHLVLQVTNVALFASAFGLLIFSFVKSIKNKSFATLSYFPTAIIFILTIVNFSFFINQALSGISFNAELQISSFFILNLTMRFIYLLV